MKIKRRTLLLFLCLALITSVLPLAAQAEAAAEPPVLTLSEMTAKPGDDLTVAVDLTENPGLMCMVFTVSYDTDRLSLTGASGAGLGGWQRSDDRVLWLGNKDEFVTGTILNLSFHVSDTAELGDTVITLEYRPGDVTNHDEDDIYPEIEAGIIHVRAEDQETPSIRITEFAEGRLDFSVTAPEGADLIIACFDADGRTISCILPPDGAVSAELPAGTEHVKLFLVEETSFMPLCRAVTQ